MGMGTGPEHHCDPNVLSHVDQGTSVPAVCVCVHYMAYKVTTSNESVTTKPLLLGEIQG